MLLTFFSQSLAESVWQWVSKRLIDTPPGRSIQATPSLTREIEHSTFNEQLSRIYYCIAVANSYCAYRAAHANPYVFLQELDRYPSQQPPQSRTRNRTKRAEIKDRFISSSSLNRQANAITERTPRVWIIGRRRVDLGSNWSIDLERGYCSWCRKAWPIAGKCSTPVPGSSVGQYHVCCPGG